MSNFDYNLNIAILVLNYNGNSHLKNFLDSAKFLKNEKHCKIVIIDNASYQDMEEIIGLYPWVLFIKNIDNFGWGEGYNQGINKMREAGVDHYTHYLFLNNDVFIDEVWWNEMVNSARTMKRDNIGEVGCRSVFADNFFSEKLFANHSSLKSSNCFMFLEQQRWNKLNNNGFIEASLVEKSILKNSSPDRLYYSFLIRNFQTPMIEILMCQHLRVLKLDLEGTLSVIKHYNINVDVDVYLIRNIDDLEFLNTTVEWVSSVNIEFKKIAIFIREMPINFKKDFLIQNSGIGIDRHFAGYDLHSLEPVSVSQDLDSLKGICGVAKLVQKDAFDAIKGFDPAYFMYYEDLDFSLRLQRKNYKIFVNQKAILKHVHGGSSGIHSPFFHRQVNWSLLYFHYRHASMFRYLKTLLRYMFAARFYELKLDVHPSAKCFGVSLTKLRQLTANRIFFRR